MYERYLTKIASHGFLVVVVGSKDFREQAAKAAAATPPPATPPQPALARQPRRDRLAAVAPART